MPEEKTKSQESVKDALTRLEAKVDDLTEKLRNVIRGFNSRRS